MQPKMAPGDAWVFQNREVPHTSVPLSESIDSGAVRRSIETRVLVLKWLGSRA